MLARPCSAVNLPPARTLTVSRPRRTLWVTVEQLNCALLLHITPQVV